MTRLERATEKARKEKDKLQEIERLARETRAAQRTAILQAEATARLEARKALSGRRYAVGAQAERAGLFVWDNATLADLFALLVTLLDAPNPVAVLEALLQDRGESLAERLLTAPEVLPSGFCTGQREKSLTPA